MSHLLTTTAHKQDEQDTTAAKVIFQGGEIQCFYDPITAAELMLETPNSFLVNSKSLQIGRRFSPLNADDHLIAGNVYVIFSKDRLFSAVNTADMATLFLAVKRASSSSAHSGATFRGHLHSSSEDSSQLGQDGGVSKSNLEEIEEFFSPEMKRRLSLRRSKKPLLDTILE